MAGSRIGYMCDLVKILPKKMWKAKIFWKKQDLMWFYYIAYILIYERASRIPETIVNIKHLFTLLFEGTLNTQFKNDSQDQSENWISLFNQCQCLRQGRWEQFLYL